ncbi:MAG: hypothetical protein AB7I45_01395 [Planctomycetota bacterium]
MNAADARVLSAQEVASGLAVLEAAGFDPSKPVIEQIVEIPKRIMIHVYQEPVRDKHEVAERVKRARPVELSRYIVSDRRLDLCREPALCQEFAEVCGALARIALDHVGEAGRVLVIRDTHPLCVYSSYDGTWSHWFNAYMTDATCTYFDSSIYKKWNRRVCKEPRRADLMVPPPGATEQWLSPAYVPGPNGADPGNPNHWHEIVAASALA